MLLELYVLGFGVAAVVARPQSGSTCPPTAPVDPIPGCWGTPGCAYVISNDLGPGAACPLDYCNCGGTIAPLLTTTTAPGASPTLNCAYTAQPTANVCPSRPSFDTFQCTQPEITDASIDPSKRWDSINTEDGWTAAIASWTSNENNGLTFTQQISNFFNGPEDMLCGVTSARDGCGSYSLCSGVNHPAGYFILNSFVAVSSLHYNLYDAISKAESQVTTLIGNFASTFAPIEDKDAALKVVLDILGLGFALIASPIWNSALKAVPFFKNNGNILGTLKDEVNPLVSNGITIAKDASLSGAKLSAQNDLSTNLGNLVQLWYTAVDRANADIFNGSDSSIKLLHDTITEGKVLDPSYGEDILGTQTAVEKAIFGYLIPQAWSYSNEGINPVIIDSKSPCGTQDPLIKYFSKDVGDNNFVCYNNNIYYILSASDGPSCPVLGRQGIVCSTDAFKPLPGRDTIDGNQWGGISINDFIQGSVNTFTANGQNGGPSLASSAEDPSSAIYDQGIQAPGIIQIPVCSVDEAYYNWEERRGANFPCN